MPDRNNSKFNSETSEDKVYFRLSWRMTMRYLFLYLVLGSLWIWLSDLFLYYVFTDSNILNAISIAKGWLFMLTSSLLFFLMLRRRQLLWSDSLHKLEQQRISIAEHARITEESKKRADEAERMRKQQLFFDTLTHLPNRKYLEQEFDRRNSNGNLGLLYIDLDDFRHINDSYGYETGNEILMSVAVILADNLREADIAARINADEFAVLIDPVESLDALKSCIVRLQNELRHSWEIDERPVYLSSSVGAAVYPEHGKNFDQLLQNAELAMMSSKINGKNSFAIYSVDIRQKAVEHADLLTQLRHAIEKNEFVVYYQPQINLKDGSVRGVEALVRWNHPVRGIVYPGEFISVAEDAGLIIAIGDLVLDEVVRQRNIWSSMGICPGTISVNISGKRFRAENLTKSLSAIIKETALDGMGRFEVELTETAMLENPEAAINSINELRNLGISFALDDFGSGYASLSYLSQLPIDILKIDMEFIRKLKNNDHNVIIVSTLISLAHGLGMLVVAEGIEEEYQLKFLRELKCDIGQGYYFSHPEPADKLTQILTRHFTVSS